MELIRRYEAKGYKALVVCDHVDAGTLEFILGILVKTCESLQGLIDMKVVPGVEITHVRPEQMSPLAKQARELGAKVVLAHGETITEPVIAGTNRSAIEAGVDVLAHPGLITPEDVKLAKERGVALEISGRKGHCLTNGHVAKLALEFGAQLVFGSDSHSPDDIPAPEDIERILIGAGVQWENIPKMFDFAFKLLD